MANVRNKAELLDYLRRRERQGEGYAALGELADAYPGARQDLEVRDALLLTIPPALGVALHAASARTHAAARPLRLRCVVLLSPAPHRPSKPSGWWSACQRQTPLVKKCFIQWTPGCEWRWMWTCRWVLLFCVLKGLSPTSRSQSV